MKRRLNIIEQSKPQWRSVEERAGNPDERIAELESPMGAREWEQSEGLSRRGFMGAAGTTLAASSALLAGCIRKPVETIVPLSERPEDRIPGAPLYYNTAARIGGSVMGLRVTSMDGRPTKVDGNPNHPSNLGGANTFAQASIMELYDGDRSRAPRSGEAEGSWDEFQAWAKGAIKRGGKVAVLLEENQSPSLSAELQAMIAAYPGARVFAHDLGRANNGIQGAALSGLAGWRAWNDLSKAKVIASFDCDFLGVEGDVVRNTKAYAASRKVEGAKADISRLYMVEPSFTNTGANADNRLRLKPSQVGPFLAAVASKVMASGASAPAGANAALGALKGDAAGQQGFVDALAKDLVANRGRGVVMVGESQPGWVHAVANMLNAALGNVGSTVHWTPSPASTDDAGSIEELAAAIKGRQVDALVILGGNPALTAPAELGLSELLGSVAASVHLSRTDNETSKLCTWHLPESHYLECWGDHTAFDGTYAIQQPLIAPLFGTWSQLQLVHFLASGAVVSGHELVQASAGKQSGGGSTKVWNRWLHDGVGPRAAASPAPLAMGSAPAMPAEDAADETMDGAAMDGAADETVDGAAPVAAAAPRQGSWDWSKLAGAVKAAPAGEFEVAFALDPRLFDGRYANIAWLQELPDPISKLSWDNAALLSPKTASEKGLKRGDMVTLTVDGRSVEAGVFVMPGVADNVAVFTLGHGRGAAGGRFAAADFNDYTIPAGGFNAYAIKGSAWFAPASISKSAGEYQFVTTQEHGRLDPTVKTPFGDVHYDRRPMVHEATMEEFNAEPGFAQEAPLFPLESLFTPPNETGGQQWGMTIDLTSCTGCNACTIACQAENNIQVAGKDRVANGRELHWIRLDRYFTGEDENEPEAVFQPIACAHCEMAPCETVCPVGATSHSPDGLNDMAYNRCIGTRYCANNCPFKVRRFNFFNFSREQHEANDLLRMQQNPNVTVRFRGVIEKCTYCTQRVQAAKIVAHRSTPSGIVPDGAIVPACAETCPADAITFGDINDPNSAVSKLKASPRNYALLQDLNIHPRTTFLSKVRNPNPELV